LWVGLGALLLFKEKLRPAFWVGLAVALSGAALLVLGSPASGSGQGAAGGDALTGGLLALVAGLFYAAFFLATQRARQGLSAFATWWIAALSSTLTLLVASLLLGQPLTGYPLNSYLALLGLALTTQVLGYLCVNYALGHLPASIVSPTLLLQPIITTLAAAPLLGEVPDTAQLLGGGLVLAGVWVINRYGQ
jgi:drug/metabolite transporter (DMT)-like permease